MKEYQDIKPPEWASRFLNWYCKKDLVEDLQGDLNEYFERNRKAKGIFRARLIFVIDVLKFLRIYTIRKPEFINLLIHSIMLGSYIKTSSRTIIRHRLFSTINIIGLAVSMSVGLLIIAVVSDLSSYDQFHEKKDRVYRVISNQEDMGAATTSVKAGRKIKETFHGVEEITLLRREFRGEANIDGKVLPVSGMWADESFFKVFTFPLIHGDSSTALKEPYSIVLTEKTARRLFNSVDVLGRTMKFDTTNYVVTGVMKDIPKLSHMRFEALGSFSTAEINNYDPDGGFLEWSSIYMTYVYMVLAPEVDLENFQAGLDKLSSSENANTKSSKAWLKLQSLNDISLGQKLRNQIGPQPNNIAVWILGGLAFVIILSACFNYTNLSIARSLRRSREVGIRKIIGAFRIHVLSQFITEAVIISLMALGVSFLLFLFLRSQFLTLDPFLEQVVSLNISLKMALYFLALALTIGVVAGFLPALFFSRINAIQGLRDISSIQLFRHVTLRKGLIVIQYVFSLIFISVTIIGYSQYKSFLTFDLGFSTENIININLQGNKGDILVKELSEIPEVIGSSQSLLVMSLGNIYALTTKYEKTNDSAVVWMNIVNEHYLPLHKYKFLAGRNFFQRPETSKESEVIVNEQLLKHFNIGNGDVSKAVGEEVMIEGKRLTIVGVVKDFHYETIEDKIEPTAFRHFTNSDYGYVNVKIASTDLAVTFERIEAAWKKVDKIHSLDAKFYDDQIEQAYQMFSTMIKVIGFFGFLSACIAFMGLFGMVVFTTETKLKEVSIRKVLGASEGTLVYLLSRGFLMLLAIAALIALPVTYLFFDKVVLSQFAYHEPISIAGMIWGLVCVIILAVLMIGSQTLKVARANPAEVLKSE